MGRARRAVGGLGIGLQRARSGADLPVLEFWRAGSGAQTRAERRRRRRALRDGAGGDDRPGGGGAELRTSRRGRRERPLWLLRGARLHRHAAFPRTRPWPSCTPIWRITRECRSWRSPMFSTTGVMRARFHAEPRMQATELLLQERTPRDVAGRPAQGRGGAGRRQRPRSRSTSPASLHFPARSDSRHPPPLQRAICGDGHDGGLRIQPLARPCGYAMAGGPHARCLGNLRFSSRRTQRPGLVGRIPTERGRTGQL